MITGKGGGKTKREMDGWMGGWMVLTVLVGKKVKGRDGGEWGMRV